MGRLKSDFSLGVVLTEPVASFLDGLVEGGELEVGQIFAEFVVAGRLLELSVGSGCVVDPLTLHF